MHVRMQISPGSYIVPLYLTPGGSCSWRSPRFYLSAPEYCVVGARLKQVSQSCINRHWTDIPQFGMQMLTLTVNSNYACQRCIVLQKPRN